MINNKNYSVYCHTNLINGKKYIGQTKYGNNPQLRWRYGTGYKNCPIFYKAILKYGWDNFEHKILKNNLSKDEANNLEEYYIKLYNACVIDENNYGYNSNYGGNNHEVSPETKEKQSNRMKLLWQSEEYKNKVIPQRIGRTHSIESRQKMSKSHKNKSFSEEHKKHLSESKVGKLFSKEHKKHLSENSAHAKKVRCIETNQIFNSCSDAAISMGMSINSKTHISRVCKSIESTAGTHPITHEKLHWEYIKTGDD